MLCNKRIETSSHHPHVTLLHMRRKVALKGLSLMQAVVVPSLEETPEQGAEEAIVEHKVNYDYLLSMPISSLTLEKVGTLCMLEGR